MDTPATGRGPMGARSPTCPPRCLRLGPAHPASAPPPPSAGAPAHRCQRTVAGGRRGIGPRRRYGLPNDLLRRPGCPVRKALSDKGGDATTDDHHQATTPVSPTNDSNVASPRPTPASRVGLRTHRHSWWHIRSGPCTPSLPSPGRPQDGFRPPLAATRAFLTNEHQ